MALSLPLLSGGRQHILGLLAEDPTWQRTRLKSADGAVSTLVQLAKRVVQDEARALILPEIQVWYKDYVAANGERPQDGGDWDEGHDDGVMALLEPYADVLSASWLHEQSTDARLWLPGEDERLAIKFGQEVWKQLTWNHGPIPEGTVRGSRTDRQILAGVGIVADDLAVFGTMAPEPVTPPQPEFKTSMMNAVINKIMLYNPADLADALDMASGDDAGLATGACQRLGITQAEGLVLRQARALGATVEDWVTVIEAGNMLDESEPVTENASATKDAFDAGPDLPDALRRLPPPPPPPIGTVKEQLQASVGTPPPPPPPPPPAVTTGAAPATNTGRGGKRTRTTEQPPAGTIPKELLLSIKEHAGIKDEDFANLLGISRPTLANIMKGKGWCTPAEDRRKALHDMLTKHSAKLAEAAGQIIPF